MKDLFPIICVAGLGVLYGCTSEHVENDATFNPKILNSLPWEKASQENLYSLQGKCAAFGLSKKVLSNYVENQISLVGNEFDYQGEILVSLELHPDISVSALSLKKSNGEPLIYFTDFKSRVTDDQIYIVEFQDTLFLERGFKNTWHGQINTNGLEGDQSVTVIRPIRCTIL